MEIDARGFSCPIPVVKTKKALESNESNYTVWVDNASARDNVSRFAKSAGYSVEVVEQEGDYKLMLKK